MANRSPADIIDPEQQSRWRTEDTGYAIESFYTGSTDGHGNKTHMRVNVPPSIAARMQQMVVQGTVPAYRTEQDIIRDALVHRLRWIADNFTQTADIRRMLEIETGRMENQRIIRELESNQEYVRETEEMLRKAAEASDEMRLRQALNSASDRLDYLQAPYKGQVEGLIDRFERHLPKRY